MEVHARKTLRQQQQLVFDLVLTSGFLVLARFLTSGEDCRGEKAATLALVLPLAARLVPLVAPAAAVLANVAVPASGWAAAGCCFFGAAFFFAGPLAAADFLEAEQKREQRTGVSRQHYTDISLTAATAAAPSSR